MRTLIIPVLVILLAGFIVTKTVKSSQRAGGYVTVPENINSVSVNAGDILDIVVRENPSTGFVWLEKSVSNPTILATLQSEGRGSGFEVDAHLPGMVGVGGTNHFLYKALNPGVVIVSLIHKRPWEQTNINERTITVTINATQ